MKRPETQYVRSGDVHIAYQVVGDGPMDLVFMPGFVSHLEYQWRLAGGARVAAEAKASEVLVSHAIKGVPGEWRLFAVDSEFA